MSFCFSEYFFKQNKTTQSTYAIQIFNCCQGFPVKVSKNWTFYEDIFIFNLNKIGINKILENSPF